MASYLCDPFALKVLVSNIFFNDVCFVKYNHDWTIKHKWPTCVICLYPNP